MNGMNEKEKGLILKAAKGHCRKAHVSKMLQKGVGKL